MKIICVIFILLTIAIYVCFFSIHTDVYCDLGSCRKKVVASTVGIKTINLTDNSISNFLLENGVKNAESWVYVRSYKGGFIKRNFFEDKYHFRFKAYIDFVEMWLRNKLENISQSEKEMVVKPILIKFIDCLTKEDVEGLKQITATITEIMGKDSEEKK